MKRYGEWNKDIQSGIYLFLSMVIGAVWQQCVVLIRCAVQVGVAVLFSFPLMINGTACGGCDT